MTGLNLIDRALVLDNVTFAGQTASTEVYAFCKDALNDLLSEWNAQGMAVFSIIRTTMAITGGTADYDLATRAEKVEAWRVIDSSGAAHGGEPVDAKTFAAKSDDGALLAARVEMLNYDANFPVATVHLYPTPTGGTLELWVWEQLTVITDFTLALAFPPGYLKAITYNLAVDIANGMGREPPVTVQKIADITKGELGATNTSEETRVPPDRRQAPKAA
jgi:hypothetical protein